MYNIIIIVITISITEKIRSLKILNKHEEEKQTNIKISKQTNYSYKNIMLTIKRAIYHNTIKQQSTVIKIHKYE